MKLSQLVSQYHALSQTLQNSDVENDPLGHEADQILLKIERLTPQDPDDVAALAKLSRHLIQVEEDPIGCLPILRNIAAWASGVQEMERASFNVIQFHKSKADPISA